MNSIFLRNGKMRVENQTKTRLEKNRVYAQKPRLKMPFKNSISDFLDLCLLNSGFWGLLSSCPKYTSLLKPSKQRLQDRHIQFSDLSLHFYHGGIWRAMHCRLCMDFYETGGGGGFRSPFPPQPPHTHSLAGSVTDSAKTTVHCFPDSSMMFFFAINCALFATDYSEIPREKCQLSRKSFNTWIHIYTNQAFKLSLKIIYKTFWMTVVYR